MFLLTEQRDLLENFHVSRVCSAVARSDIRGRFPLCCSDYPGFFAYLLCVCIRVHLDSGYSLLYRENIVVKIKTKFFWNILTLYDENHFYSKNIDARCIRVSQKSCCNHGYFKIIKCYKKRKKLYNPIALKKVICFTEFIVKVIILI